MKTAHFISTLVACGALSLGPALAGEPSNPGPETAPSKVTGARPPEAGHGLQPGAGKERSEGERSEQERDESHAFGNSSRTSGAKSTAKTHSVHKLPQSFRGNGGRPGEKRINNAQGKSTSGNVGELHQPGLNKSSGGAKTGGMVNEMEDQRHLPAAGLSGTRPPNLVVPYRGPGPAAIGGPALYSARNAAVITGTGMKRKP